MALLDVATGLSLISTGLKFYSAFKGGEDREDMYQAQAQTAYLDARRALLDARQVREVASVNAAVVRKSGADYRSAARAAFGANGIDVNYGSAVDVQQDITERADQDAINQLLLGERQARTLEDTARGLLQQGQQYEQAGSNAQRGGWLSAAGSALSGAADVWSKWKLAEGD